jgi:protein phosphatase PTC1
MAETNATVNTTAPAVAAKSVKDFGQHEDRNKGKRRKMEDAACQVDQLGAEEHCGFFAVFDGHSGADAAKFCAANLHLVRIDGYARRANLPCRC